MEYDLRAVNLNESFPAQVAFGHSIFTMAKTVALNLKWINIAGVPKVTLKLKNYSK